MAKRVKRGKASAGGMRRYDTLALVAERDRRRAKLEERRDAVLAELQEIERAIADLGGPATRSPARPARKKKAGSGGRRGRGGVSLAQAIGDALSKHGPLGVPDLIKAVRKAGYRSTSANFRSMVSQRLMKDGRFKRVSRGVYALKGKATS